VEKGAGFFSGDNSIEDWNSVPEDTFFRTFVATIPSCPEKISDHSSSYGLPVEAPVG
jgi:hypothetical protein